MLKTLCSVLPVSHTAQGMFAEAVRSQTRASEVEERYVELNVAVGSERERLALLASLSSRSSQSISLHTRLSPDDPAARDLAATTILRRKGRVQDAMSGTLAALRRRSGAEDQKLLDQLSDVTSKLSRLVLNGPQKATPAEHQEQIKKVEEERERLEAEISHRSAGFYEQSEPVTLAAVQAAIPVDAALIEFAVYRPFDPKAPDNQKAYGEPRYVAYVMRNQGEVQWKELGEAKDVDEGIEALRQAFLDPKRNNVKHVARAVDEKVMQPVRALIGDAAHLLVSPDGALNLIPFEALVDEQGKYLIERYSFNYLTSGRDLLRLQAARASKSEPFVLADPLFGESEIANAANADAPRARRASPGGKRQSVTTGTDLSSVYFGSLSGTAQEARAIRSLFPEAHVITGREATESALKRVNAPRILHIATHGFFLHEAPSAATLVAANRESTRGINASVKIENPLLRSGLALAGANVARKAGEDDGILTALEASGLNLWGTKLVTLSACDTGVGEVKTGEGVYGLRRALVLAGTETLMMSLWPVSDYVTRELMTAYYKGLKHGQGRGESLRQVQLSMLKRKGREHPFYWASFIQSGEWANLDGKR
jgi:CHAT domain-containing protein